MDLQSFINQRPYLYHLTSQINAPSIISQKRLFSANSLILQSQDDNNLILQRTKRHTHHLLPIQGQECILRDQRPISEKALAKCLTDGWKVDDFLYHLNDRVFMWPTLERLWRHFKRYEHEEPIIFRFSTSDILFSNPHVKFSRLNSGATRANSHLGGKAPARGPNTFLPANEFNFSVRDVAEVTFESFCHIQGIFSYSRSPDGQFVYANNEHG